MAALGRKLRTIGGGKIAYYCPGCESYHMIYVGNASRPQWYFDGNVEAPTFTPSVNVGPGSSLQCHHFVRAGKIEFLPDCWHQYKGKTVDLPDWPVEEEQL